MSFCKSGLLAFTADCEPVKDIERQGSWTARQNGMPTTETREFWKPHIMESLYWRFWCCFKFQLWIIRVLSTFIPYLRDEPLPVLRIFSHGKQRSQNSHLRKEHPTFHMNPHTIPTSVLSGHVGSWKGTQQHWMQSLLHPQLNGVVCSKSLQISLSK